MYVFIIILSCETTLARMCRPRQSNGFPSRTPNPVHSPSITFTQMDSQGGGFVQKCTPMHSQGGGYVHQCNQMEWYISALRKFHREVIMYSSALRWIHREVVMYSSALIWIQMEVVMYVTASSPHKLLLILPIGQHIPVFCAFTVPHTLQCTMRRTQSHHVMMLV
jgi:hypothetical protein